MMRRLSSQRGVGILPIALSLIVTGLIFSGVIMRYSDFQKNKEVTSSFEDIRLFKDRIERLFAHKRNYNGLDADFLIAHAELPDSMINRNDNTVQGRFNYYNQIGSYDFGPAGNGFHIRANFVSDNACPVVATSQLASEAETVRVWNDGGGEVFTSKPEVSDIAGICFNGRPATHIEFRFGS